MIRYIISPWKNQATFENAVSRTLTMVLCFLLSAFLVFLSSSTPAPAKPRDEIDFTTTASILTRPRGRRNEIY